MWSPSVQITLPSSSLFTFPPNSDPITLPAAAAGSSFSAPPFSIPESWYNEVLQVKYPITIAAIYAVTVLSLNASNKKNGNKPWAISKTSAFFWFVIAHNVFLAVYSGWTFVGMFTALRKVIAHPMGPDGLAGTVDSLCKIHGTAGLSNSITYSPQSSTWISGNPLSVLLNDVGTPYPTDEGRLWNEGLAFYGWFFYLSKFYEVLDTAIILVKGKKSSTLQTYHHAGAMMCMWAGIRFMSPPIWMFVFVNSGIHAMMYTYYTLTALSFRIPNPIKRALTTLQIIQFLVGASYAAIHSFVSYTVPVSVADTIRDAPSKAASSVSSAVASAAATGVGAMVKKLLLRAAGEQGLAENVGVPQSSHAANPHPAHKYEQATTYHTEYKTVACIDTSGQTFAIWLNVLYLAPLTVLFVRFFIRSYLRRTGAGKKAGVLDGKMIEGKGAQKGVRAVEGAGKDAFKGVERENEGANLGDLKDLSNGKVNGSPNGKANGKVNGKAKH